MKKNIKNFQMRKRNQRLKELDCGEKNKTINNK